MEKINELKDAIPDNTKELSMQERLANAKEVTRALDEIESILDIAEKRKNNAPIRNRS